MEMLRGFAVRVEVSKTEALSQVNKAPMSHSINEVVSIESLTDVNISAIGRNGE